jgi:hypothetical protein
VFGEDISEDSTIDGQRNSVKSSHQYWTSVLGLRQRQLGMSYHTVGEPETNPYTLFSWKLEDGRLKIAKTGSYFSYLLPWRHTYKALPWTLAGHVYSTYSRFFTALAPCLLHTARSIHCRSANRLFFDFLQLNYTLYPRNRGASKYRTRDVPLQHERGKRFIRFWVQNLVQQLNKVNRNTFGLPSSELGPISVAESRFSLC